MEIRFVPLDLARIDGLRYEAIVLPVHSDERPLRGAAGLCDWRLCGKLSRLLQRGWARMNLGEVTMVPARPRLPFDKILLFGAGDSSGFTPRVSAELNLRMLETLAGLRLRTFVMALPGRSLGRLGAAEAILGFLSTPGIDDAVDEAVIVDGIDTHKVMAPLVEAEKRRQRVLREGVEG